MQTDFRSQAALDLKEEPRLRIKMHFKWIHIDPNCFALTFLDALLMTSPPLLINSPFISTRQSRAYHNFEKATLQAKDRPVKLRHRTKRLRQGVPPPCVFVLGFITSNPAPSNSRFLLTRLTVFWQLPFGLDFKLLINLLISSLEKPYRASKGKWIVTVP